MIDNRVQAGDVFVKQWGQREIVLVMLPRTPSSAKQPYLRLPAGTTEGGYWSRREQLDRRKYRYVGTVPLMFLPDLIGRLS